MNDLYFVNTNHKKIFHQELNDLGYKQPELVISGKP